MIIGIFGKPGAGKSTIFASVARKNYLKRQAYYKRVLNSKLYHRLMTDEHLSSSIRNSLINFLYPKNFYDVVYSTDDSIHHTVFVDYKDLGMFKPIPNSLFLLEEAGLGIDSRKFKELSAYSTRFASKHRHQKVDILYCSQSVDVDKKYRQRTELIYVAKKLGAFTVLKKIYFEVGVEELNHSLVEGYWKQGPWKFIFEIITSIRKKWRMAKLPFAKSCLIYRPKWYPYFDSFEDDFDYPKEDPIWKYVLDYIGDDYYYNMLKEQALKEAKERKELENETEDEYNAELD